MPDFFDPSMLVTDDWWDVPADYFSGGDMLDYSQLGGGDLNTDFGNLGGVPSTTGYGDFYTAPWNMSPSGEDTLFYDTQTGQVITGPQAQQIDPSFDWMKAAKMAIGGATALGGLGAVGLGLGSLFGSNDPANQTTTQTSATGKAAMTPEMTALLGSGGTAGGAAGGVGGAAGSPGTGLMSLSNTMIQNLMGSGQGAALGLPGGQQMAPPQQYGGLGTIGYAGGTPNFNESTGTYAPGTGPMWQQQTPGGQQPQGGQTQQGGSQGLIGQQSNILGGLQGQIPQLNPAIMQALGMQAQGMAQGMLPSLNDPQAQARIQGIYQPGFDALNYNSGLALSSAREQLQQRGFQAPDIREGPTQALTAPILAAQQLGRSQLYGQMAGAQLDLATRLPMLGSQLNAQNYATQMQPFTAGLNLAGAYNQPIGTQAQFPLSLLDILQRGQGSTSTVNTVGPQPSLTQQLGQVAPLVGAGGSLLSSAGNTLFPQQQNPYGFAYNPFTGASLSGAP